VHAPRRPPAHAPVAFCLFESRVDADLDPRQRTRYRAVLAGSRGRLLERRLIDPRYAAGPRQLGGGDGRRPVALIERDLGADAEVLGFVARLGQAVREVSTAMADAIRDAESDGTYSPSIRGVLKNYD